jgi:hypothetical protein
LHIQSAATFPPTLSTSGFGSQQAVHASNEALFPHVAGSTVGVVGVDVGAGFAALSPLAAGDEALRESCERSEPVELGPGSDEAQARTQEPENSTATIIEQRAVTMNYLFASFMPVTYVHADGASPVLIHLVTVRATGSVMFEVVKGSIACVCWCM